MAFDGRFKFDHLVVLMMENRGFDHLLGYLYEHDRPALFLPEGTDPVFRGVAGRGDLGAPDDHDPPRRVPVQRAPWETLADMTVPFPDPGEEFTPHMCRQIYGVPELRPGGPELSRPATMDGFVRDYLEVARDSARRHRPGITDEQLAAEIMSCFPPEATPVLSGLARAYAVSDAWFASVPSQTYCNRSFLHAADSHGWVDNFDYAKWSHNDAPTVFQLLEQRFAPGRDFRIYWDPTDLVPITRVISGPLYDERYDDRFCDMETFEADCAAGTLPAYSFLQPRILLDNNDMHPAYAAVQTDHSSILAGDALIARVYDALRAGAAWDRTLFVILFDEHGGTYDHVPPPAATPPHDDPPYPLEHGFGFDRFGVRVPAVIVSPFIEAGTVVRGPGPVPFDHTSIIKTLCERFDLPSLTARDRAAPDLSFVLTRAEPRREAPAFTPRPSPRKPKESFLRDPLAGLQRSLVAHAARRRGLRVDFETLGELLSLIG